MPFDANPVVVPVVDDAVALLCRARQRVAGGWCQRYYHLSEPVRFCSAGAIIRDVTLESLYLPSYNRAYQFFKQAIDGQPIISWNDAPERTQAEVVAAFDRAIALAQGET